MSVVPKLSLKKAGWFEVVVDSWWLPTIPVTLGNRADIDV
jgi:hypothetical protein